jgi:hypothetical protein
MKYAQRTRQRSVAYYIQHRGLKGRAFSTEAWAEKTPLEAYIITSVNPAGGGVFFISDAVRKGKRAGTIPISSHLGDLEVSFASLKQARKRMIWEQDFRELEEDLARATERDADRKYD